MSLVSALGLASARLVALCGAGGKTSLMFALADELAGKGERVLVTTTTRLAREEAEGARPWLHAAGAGAVLDRAGHCFAGRPGGVLVAVRGPAPSGDKVIGFAPETVAMLARRPLFERILVEADGSKRRPLKASAEHEPMIPPSTDTVILVAGLSGIGQPLGEETVLRVGPWAALTGLAAGAPVTARSLAVILERELRRARDAAPGCRVVVFLNQADDTARLNAASAVDAALEAAAPHGLDRVVTGCLRPKVRIVAASVARARG